jgi:glutamate-1-semialdehyde aminotransferase
MLERGASLAPSAFEVGRMSTAYSAAMIDATREVFAVVKNS